MAAIVITRRVFLFYCTVLLILGAISTICITRDARPERSDGTTHAAPGSGVLLMSNDDDIEPGSDLYWRLPSVRSELLKAVRAARGELNDSVHSIPGNVTQDQAISRAIIVYLPPAAPKFVKELKALYLSIGVMRTSQKPGINTDLIVFTAASEVDNIARDFGCALQLRSSKTDSERCIVIPHIPSGKRVRAAGSIIPPVTSHPAYIDSMFVLAEFSAGVHQYDYLLRTDLDTFMVPGFADWILGPDIAIATGRGGYGHNNSNKHLSWLMRDQLKLTDGGLLNIGSTWYGHSQVMVSAAKLTIAAMDWLHTQEFSDFEKFHAGTDGWPNWHWPVTLLYGGHIAINQIPKEKVIQTVPDQIEMDFGTSNKTPSLLKPGIKHMHCWHSDILFSKFQFAAGKYDDMDLTEYAAMETAQGYAAVVAVSSGRLSLPELVEYIASPSRMQANEWKRLLKNVTADDSVADISL